MEISKLNCTLPWIESMQGFLDYTEEEKPTCNTSEDYNILRYFGQNFAVAASAFDHPNCLGSIRSRFYVNSMMYYNIK